MSFVFTSERLGFREWKPGDLDLMAAINGDAEVMKYFPSTATREDTKKFIDRMKLLFLKKGFCYFAVELLKTKEFIGFIGLGEQRFDAEFTPCIDIGWRLDKKHWFSGYATEGAKACLDFGFDRIGLAEIYALAPIINTKSIAVMKKISMNWVSNFIHPMLVNDKRLMNCALYAKNKV